MTVAPPQPKHRFVVLDGLRGGAAIMVVVTHTSNLAPMAYLAVGFFFLLSGFVLAHSAAEKLQAAGRHGRAARLRYGVGRLIRLYPLYLAGTAIALPPAAIFALHRYDFWTPKVFAVALGAAPFFIPLPYEFNFPFNMPAWTLPFELLANFVFMFTGWRWLPVILILLIGGPLMLWDPGNSYWQALAGEVPVALFCFFLGVAMCRGWCGGRLPKFGMHPLALLTILCGFLGYPAGNPFLYAAVFTVAVQPLLVWVGACSTAAGFTARLMAWLGKVSYGVYVLHFPITLWEAGFTGWLGKFHPHLAARIDGLAVLYVLPLSLVAAHVLTVQLDAPLRKFLSARFDAQLKKAKPEAVLFL